MKDEKGSAGAQHAPQTPLWEVVRRPVKQNVFDQGKSLDLRQVISNANWWSGLEAGVILFWIVFFLLPAVFPLLQLGTDEWQCQVLLPVCSFLTCHCLASLVLLAVLLEETLGVYMTLLPM